MDACPIASESGSSKKETICRGFQSLAHRDKHLGEKKIIENKKELRINDNILRCIAIVMSQRGQLGDVMISKLSKKV